MKKYFRYMIFIIFALVSFYFTEKTATLVRSKDPIMQEIKTYAKEKNIDAVDAQISDQYIIPGMYGKKVNEIKSLMNMKTSNVFNSLFLDMDSIKPNISLDDNKDKIINKGNVNKRAISFILENDESNFITYFVTNKIDASLLVNLKTINKNPFFEQINNDFENYMEVEKYLNKENINNNICIINKTNKKLCLKNNKYIVKPSLILNNSNMVSVKNKLSSGDIILIKEDSKIEDIIYLIKYINSKGLNIIKLSDLISEKN